MKHITDAIVCLGILAFAAFLVLQGHPVAAGFAFCVILFVV